MSLFDTKDIDAAIKEKKGIAPISLNADSSLAYLKSQETIKEYVGELQEGKCIRYVTKGQWSMHELIRYCVMELQEPCDLYLATWTISSSPIECLHNLKNEGYIKELHCLFDYRIKDGKSNAEAFQLLQSFAQSIALTKIHAKVSVIIGQNRGFSIVSSSNLTKNPRIEAGVLFCDYAIAKADKEWIMNEITLCNTQKSN